MNKVRQLQRSLYRKAKQDKEAKFYSLYDKLWREDVLWEAWRQVKANRGAPGVDGASIEAIVSSGQEGEMISRLGEQLRAKTYRLHPVRRVDIPKPKGGTRPLGIATVEDRVVQTAMKLVLEPIFEADFHDCSYGYRPKRDAKGASLAIREDLYRGAWGVVEIDFQSYFTTIPHDKLLTLIRQRIVDGSMLWLIRQSLKVGVAYQGRVEPTQIGVPQGSPIAPLYSNIYGRLFGRKGTVASMLPWIDGNPRPHSGMHRSQAHGAWSASRRQRDLCVGRRPARGRRVGENQKGKPVIGEDET
jgi:RNA-directed DNA polymerase